MGRRVPNDTDMSPLAEQHIEFIQFLDKLSLTMRTKLISSLSNCHINTLSEIFTNFLLKCIAHDPEIIKHLKPYKKQVREVARKNAPMYRKKQILKSEKAGGIHFVYWQGYPDTISSWVDYCNPK